MYISKNEMLFVAYEWTYTGYRTYLGIKNVQNKVLEEKNFGKVAQKVKKFEKI